jgi:hypothetical protein
MFLLLFACSSPVVTDAELIANARLHLRSSPVDAVELCLEIDSMEVRAGCVEQAALLLALDDLSASLSSCEQLENPDECMFKVAEVVGDAELCQRAGEFEFNCKMHVFSNALHSWVPRGASPSDIPSIAGSHISAATLSPDDPRPWSAIWRWVLGAQRPLDRSSCSGVDQPMEREACEMTAITVFNDRLNHYRDLGLHLCEGDLPPPVQYLSDPELDRVLSMRRSQDLCDNTAVLAPPIGGLPGEGL